MQSKITEKQKKALSAIYESIRSSGFPPTFADLREKLNVVSNQAVLNFLESLEKKGFIKREDGQARSIKILPLGYKEIEKEPLIKIAGMSAAGSYTESFADAFTAWMPLSDQIFQNEKISKAQDDVFVIQVHGDSMINAGIDDGNMLLIKKSKEFKSGDIVVARTENGTTVKKFIADGGKRYLKPENPNYENIPIIPGEITFEGKMILNLTKINT
ncbi:MAG: transcriptional repressor LexA [Candidatus Moranbacteria bacterium]|nr:transcriptional repressor LexA [Candidatus Moranbacteria bacterium]